MNDGASQTVANQIYDGLIRISERMDLEPAIAESWATSSDGRTITFHLRREAKFHDGSKVTSDDVVFSLARAIESPIVGSLYEYIARDSSGKPKLIAVDLQTVNVILKAPFPPILSVLTGVTAKILPRLLLQSNPKFFEAPIGSGPFRFVSRDETARSLTLAGDPHYYGGVPKIQTLVLKESSLPEAVSLARSGTASEIATHPLPFEHEVFRDGKRLTSPVVATWIIGLNIRIAPLNRLSVRLALKQALEDDSYRKRFYPDALPAYGYIPPGLPGHIGIHRAKPSATLSDSDRKTIQSLAPIVIQIPDALENVTGMAAHLEQTARMSGIKITVVPTQWDQLMDGYTKHTSQAFLVSMNMDYPDSAFLLQNAESTNPDNFSGLQDQELDRLVAKSRLVQDRVERDRIHTLAVKRFEDQAVTINLFHQRQNLWVHRCVSGLVPHLMGDIYLDYRQVHIDESCMKMKVANR